LFRVKESEIDELIKSFRIRVDLTEKVLDREALKVYKVKTSNKGLEAFLIDSPEARAIACLPHIVSRPFEYLNTILARRASEVVAGVVKNLELKPIFLHVLRAAPGYKLHEALRRKGLTFTEIHIRPKYQSYSFRDHVERRITVVYKNFEELPRGENVVLIKPDTEATGLTGERALEEIYREALKRSTSIEALVLYGFISEKGLQRLYRKTQELNIRKVYAFILVDLTSLAFNNYDMVLYGLDESRFSAKGERAHLGSVIDRETFEKCVAYYMPGMDQPGDWSARQDKLFNGENYERGNIRGHLSNSLTLAKRLYEISRREPWFKPWHKEVFLRGITSLQKVLEIWTCQATHRIGSS